VAQLSRFTQKRNWRNPPQLRATVGATLAQLSHEDLSATAQLSPYKGDIAVARPFQGKKSCGFRAAAGAGTRSDDMNNHQNGNVISFPFNQLAAMHFELGQKSAGI
jgi:hypothetical protein